MVHVKQKHTVDLIIGELVAILNWYNPFAWLIRHAIRQNLEFIADKNVLDKGFDKKEYQYLLLKVVGLQQYGIVNNFSLPHLKKRIIMMNKMKSASLHLTRFLFALPLLSIVLLAFRSEKLRIAARPETAVRPVVRMDTVPSGTVTVGEPVTATKMVSGHPTSGKYNLSLANDAGEYLVIVKDKRQKIVKAMTMADWNQDLAANEKKYGPIPPWPATVITVKDVKLEDLGVVGYPATTVTVKGRKIDQASDNRIGVEDLKLEDAKSNVLHAIIIRSSDSASLGKPLIILDGKPQPPDFNVNSIPAQSIQSITVLKGSDATNKYGDRVKDGAIEITSKTPEQRKTDTIRVQLKTESK